MIGHALTAAEIADYETDGVVIPEFRIPDPEVTRLREALQRVLDANPDRRPENLMNVHISDGPEGNVGDPAFMDFAAYPPLLDSVEAVIGEDIFLWGCALFCKPAATGLEVPWHQDGHYWPIRPLANCTVWLALDEVAADNGCMRVIPGSHRDGLRSHHTDSADTLALDQVLDDDAFDPAAARDIVLSPGQFSMHDVNLIHGSNANTSGRRRAGLALRYMPATSVFVRDLSSPSGATRTSAPNFADRPIFLMRGRDVSGKNTKVVDMVPSSAATATA